MRNKKKFRYKKRKLSEVTKRMMLLWEIVVLVINQWLKGSSSFIVKGQI